MFFAAEDLGFLYRDLLDYGLVPAGLSASLTALV